MSYQVSLSRTSALAVWSFLCGLLSIPCCICLGLPAIAAILLGHFALSAIADSAGTLRGRGLAMAGLILGYAGLALAIAGFVWQISWREKNRGFAEEVQASVLMQPVVQAVNAYYTAYGKLPPGLQNSGDLTLSTDNNRLLDILRGHNKADNPKGTVFYLGQLSPLTPPRFGLGADGVLYDPWGRPYFIALDSNGDGVIDNPYPKGAGPTPVHARVLVWSQGADGQPGKLGDGDGAADILSWHEHEFKTGLPFGWKQFNFNFSGFQPYPPRPPAPPAAVPATPAP